MIISAADIQSYRPIAQNIGNKERIEPYIQEAEEMYIIPQLGARIYKQIGDVITKTSTNETIDLLLHGGFYNGNNAYFAGLIAATAYLTYSRMIRNQSVNITAFGVVFKNGELSERADDATIARMSNEAVKIGLQHLHDCVEFLKWAGVIESQPCKIRRTKIRVIGERDTFSSPRVLQKETIPSGPTIPDTPPTTNPDPTPEIETITENINLAYGLFDDTDGDNKIVWYGGNGDLRVIQQQGSGSTKVNSNYLASPRLYKGHILAFLGNTSDDVKILQVELVYDGGYRGCDLTFNNQITDNDTTVEDSAIIERNLSTETRGTHIFKTADLVGEHSIYLQNTCATENVQLLPVELHITYTRIKQ